MEHAHEESGMHRALSATNLTTLGIGAIIGAGIFVLTGQAAAQYAGPAIVISFIISGLACLFAGLCYAEFASMIPISGSAYTYAYSTLGEFMAWIIGWDLILEYLFAASTVSVGWSGYMVSFLKDFGLSIPPQYTAAWNSVLVDIPKIGWKPLTEQLSASLSASGIAVDSLPHVTAILNLPAMFIIAAITILLVIGIKESAGFNNVMVIIKVFVILLFISPSSTAVDRLALYFIPLQLFVFSRLPQVLGNEIHTQGIWVLVVLIYSFIVQFIWLFYAQHREFWIPYQFYPWLLLWT